MAALHSYLSKISLFDSQIPNPKLIQMQILSLFLIAISLSLILAISLSLLRRNRSCETLNQATETHREAPEPKTEEPTCLDSDGVAGAESFLREVSPERVDRRRKKKRAKKKSLNSIEEEEEEEEEDGKSNNGVRVRVREKEELACLYPFTSSSSVTQRKIKQHYDELMKSHHSKGLTLTQVGQFANCLVEAKNELQHKADVIQRKFTITKALLFKADRSSFDRLRQQIYKLELEQKRLEEDAFVYNWLQQQLKLSPAYKKMLEIGARMELKAKSGELLESTDNEYSDISFEELLAREKKDSFWQRNGKLRRCTG